LTLPSVSVERERLVAYDRVCGFSLSDTLPPTYIHILAFPLHLKLMSEPSFPFRAIGLVHIANEITQHRHVNAGEKLSLRVVPTALSHTPGGSSSRCGPRREWARSSCGRRCRRFSSVGADRLGLPGPRRDRRPTSCLRPPPGSCAATSVVVTRRSQAT
ncbi:MAG TPA: hypothetical protein VGL78_12525, partial [Solirubrobacteraceae bacterium]